MRKFYPLNDMEERDFHSKVKTEGLKLKYNLLCNNKKAIKWHKPFNCFFS